MFQTVANLWVAHLILTTTIKSEKTEIETGNSHRVESKYFRENENSFIIG